MTGPKCITVLYDGACPLCRREAAFLRRRDRERGKIDLEDISDPAFDASKYSRTWDQLMSEIHGVLPDGSVISGLEVFRRAYAAIGLGWLLAPTRLPVINRIADRAYTLFARNRLRLTGRHCACRTM